VLSPGGDEAPGGSSAVVTTLSLQPVCQHVDPNVIFRRDPSLVIWGRIVRIRAIFD
jgi:hypothetical protein